MSKGPTMTGFRSTRVGAPCRMALTANECCTVLAEERKGSPVTWDAHRWRRSFTVMRLTVISGGLARGSCVAK